MEDQLPTIAIVAHYDALGIAPVSIQASNLKCRDYTRASSYVCEAWDRPLRFVFEMLRWLKDSNTSVPVLALWSRERQFSQVIKQTKRNINIKVCSFCFHDQFCHKLCKHLLLGTMEVCAINISKMNICKNQKF